MTDRHDDRPRRPLDEDAEATVVLGARGVDPDAPLPAPAPDETVVAPQRQATATATELPEPDPLGDGSAQAVTEAPARAAAPTGQGPSLGRASAIMAAGTLVSRVLGLVRQFLLAGVVAASAVSDAFNVANTLPNYLFQLLNAGVLNAVLIPQITKAMKRHDGGQDFVNRLITAAIGSILALTLVGLALAPWLVDLTSGEKVPLHLATAFAYICLPQILFYGLYAVLGNVLNARNQFAAFMWAPALSNVVQIAGLATFLALWGQQTDPSVWSPAMIWTLAGSMSLGILLQALVLVVPLWRGGFRYRPRFGLRGHGFGEASRMLGWTLTAIVIAQLGGLFTQWVLTEASRGAFTAYGYAMIIFMLPHGLITVSILTALFPQMSRTWQDSDVAGLRRLVNRGLRTPAVAIIPASAAMVAMARPLVDVMLRLPDDDARQVAEALQIMAVGTLGFGLSTLQQRYSFAREEGRQNLAYQAFLTALQVSFALAALLVLPHRFALATVALGLVVGNWAVSLVFIAVARRQLDGLGLAGVARLWTRLLIASVLAAGTAWLVVYGMTGFGASWLLSAITCVLAGLAFGLVFLAVSRILHLREVDELLAPVLRRLHLAR
ncbi:murein biosynthesis integral membrane protein MurJ [Luteococcus peritonei]|uniref:Murein biosynthesis integral membrane protein MurJ n=1 Tax=Luteococcus peritonei TaxID=88874 RepID=A0ABW4RX62_9ACTN